MAELFFNADWWDWGLFLIIPVLLAIGVLAIWAVFSALATLWRGAQAGPVDARKVPDIMGFLKQRYTRATRRPPEETYRERRT